MLTLNLTTKGTEQELLKKYLEENASEELAQKINNGVQVMKDGKALINKKTLEGFMKYAYEEARKQAEKGARCACLEDKVVFGWVIHYFEEDFIEESLYYEDGTPYKAVTHPPKTTTVTQSKEQATKPIEESSQMTLFDFSALESDAANENADVSEDKTEKEPFEVLEGSFPTEEKEEKVEEVAKAKPETLYDKYKAYQEKFPIAIIAMRVGDFYEIFGDAAVKVSEHLEMTLTSRDFGLAERVKMVGFPFHKLDIYREKIRDFSSIAIIENPDDMKFYLRHTKGTPDMMVDVATGEIIEESSPAKDDLIAILFGILKDDLEDKR